MITLTKPANLNGTELLSELAAKGVVVSGLPIDDGQGNLLLDIDATDKEKAKTVVDSHDGTTIAADNSAAKAALLEKLGITSDEAALLLS
jgi:hypothetical protein